MKWLLIAVLTSGSALAAIPTPERPITNPQELTSPVNLDAVPVPISDLAYSKSYVDAAWSADGKTVFIVTDLTGRFNVWRIEASGGWPQQMVQSEDIQTDLAPSPDGKVLLFAQDSGGDEYYDLYAVPTVGGLARRITNTPEIAETSPNYSVDGKQVAILVRGKTETSTNIGLLDLANGAVHLLTAEKSPELNWNIVRWTPDGTGIIANRGDIASTTSSIWHIDVPSGITRELIRSNEALIYATDISADGKVLAISSNQDSGQLRAGLFEFATGKYRWLTPTPWEQTSGTMSPDGKTLLVRTRINGRDTVSLVAVTTGEERPLEFPSGVNEEAPPGKRAFAADNRHALIYHASADTQGEIYIADTVAGSSRPLTRFSIASLDPSRLPKSTVVTYRSFDNTAIGAVLTMPFNLKRDASNPAVVIPHGGPTGQAKDYFDGVAAALASRGYLVIKPNFRGSTGYGKAFQEANIKDLGGGDLQDVLAAKDFLVASGYVDARRVGIFGASYGGFMTLMALGKYPDAFAAGVQWYGIINWNSMWETSDSFLREYMRKLVGDPQEDAELYALQSPMTYLRKAKAPLLSLQGENDIRVPRQQAKDVAKLLEASGVVTETTFYAEEGHGFNKRENENDAIEKTVAWFEQHLKGRQ